MEYGATAPAWTKALRGMFFRTAKISVFFAAIGTMAVVLSPVSAQAASKAASKNIETLLKTNKCPKCDLAKANLAKANLAKANLESANLKGANFRGANLEEANLKGADLRQTDLTGAGLKGAFCRLTNFNGAKMPDGKPFSIANNPKKYGCRR